jgi:hypothetical protein
LSFDLVNSTAFKTNFRAWHVVIHYFYELLVKELQTKCEGIKVWKYVGDEVLLYKQITNLDELSKDIPKVFHVCRSVSRAVQNSFDQARNFLSVKATVWIARAAEVPPQDINGLKQQLIFGGASEEAVESPNIVVRVTSGEEQQSMDFLGPDVDAGFRIAKFSHSEKLTVSADLAYLLSMHGRANDIRRENLRIISYEELKGIWAGRYYPIVWYYEDWKEVAASFGYDEEFRSDLIKKARDAGIKPNIDNLKKIFSGLNKEKQVDTFIDAIVSDSFKDKYNAIVIPRARLAEVHCVAICIAPDARILAGRRPSNKRVYPGAWEFGCTQLREDQSFEEAIHSGYKEDFGLLLSDVSPAPIAVYVIEGQRKIPGLIFVAKAQNPEQPVHEPVQVVPHHLQLAADGHLLVQPVDAGAGLHLDDAGGVDADGGAEGAVGGVFDQKELAHRELGLDRDHGSPRASPPGRRAPRPRAGRGW